MAKSVYIHIPFCKQKCKYCSFVSFTNNEKMLGYIFSLLKEIDTNYCGEELDTLYFGGGTPSLIEIQYLKKIINKFNLSSNCEITLELNPDDITEELFSEYLYTKNQPDIDLLIRTSGEQRLSNFLLWQNSYSELWFTNKLWPDFSKKDLYSAIADFQKRNRRFGGV